MAMIVQTGCENMEAGNTDDATLNTARLRTKYTHEAIRGSGDT